MNSSPPEPIKSGYIFETVPCEALSYGLINEMQAGRGGPGLAAERIEPHELRDSVRLRAMVANGLTRIEQAVGDLLVDRPRRNILRRGNVGGAA
jgi:hypothetical protein